MRYREHAPPPPMRLGLIDRAIALVAPTWALRRQVSRLHLKRALDAGAYDAAKQGDSVWNSLRGAQGSPDVLLRGALATIRNRARHGFRNNGVLRAVVRAKEALMVGGGIDVEPDTGNDDWDERIKAVWDQFVLDLDPSGELTLWDLERQDMRMEELMGASMWYLQYDEALLNEGRIPLQVRALHPAQLSLSPVDTYPEGNTFRNGREYDSKGRIVAYHITDNPGDYLILAQEVDAELGLPGIRTKPMRVRILAEFVLYSYEQHEPGQAIGEPGVAPIISRAHDAGELVSTELTASKMSAAPALVITSPTTAGQNYGTDSQDDNGNPWNNFEPGMVVRTLPGEDAKAFENKRPAQNVFTFLKGIYGILAGAARIPVRAIDRDPSQANFSSLGADNIDQERSLEPEAERYGRQKPGALYQRALPLLCAAAGVPMPRDPFARRRFSCYRLVMEKRPYVNRLDDVRASILAIDAGLSTYEDELGRLGKNARDALKKWKAEQQTDAVKAINAHRAATSANGGKADMPKLGAPAPAANGTTDDTDADAEADQDPAEVAAGANAVQDTALNGAQVQALQEIISAVASGTLPAATAKAMITAAFPAMSAGEVDAMLSPLTNFEPAMAGPLAPPAPTDEEPT